MRQVVDRILWAVIVGSLGTAALLVSTPQPEAATEAAAPAVTASKSKVETAGKKKVGTRKLRQGRELQRVGVVNVRLEDNVSTDHAKLIRQAGRMLSRVIPLKFRVTRANKSPRLPQIEAGMRCEENAQQGSWGLAWGEWNRVSYACDISDDYHIRQVMVHELAHAVGVPHLPTPGQLMSAQVPAEQVATIGQPDSDWIRGNWDGYPGDVYRWVVIG